MSEIGDLIGILGAVDRAVNEDEGDNRRSLVAGLVKAYRKGGRFGWYDRFVEREGQEVLPRIEEAMENLGRPTRFAGMLPRRVLAVALVARVFPELFGPDGEYAEASLRVLVIPGIVAGLPLVPTPPLDEPPDVPDLGDPSTRSQGEQLLRALADPNQLARIEDWRTFLDSTSHLVSSQLASLPTPCSTTVIEPPTGPDEAIVVLQTSLCVGGVDLDGLSAGFLDPTNWPTCSPWWCEMLPAPGGGPGLKRFLEVVAADCPNHVFEVAVFLDFATAIDTGTRKVVTYNKSPDQSGMVAGLRANDAVEVDRGVIDIRRERDHFRVETTKRIRFAQTIDADALAVIACVVGYGDVAADVICDCSGATPACVPRIGAARGHHRRGHQGPRGHGRRPDDTRVGALWLPPGDPRRQPAGVGGASAVAVRRADRCRTGRDPAAGAEQRGRVPPERRHRGTGGKRVHGCGDGGEPRYWRRGRQRRCRRDRSVRP
jgi:hypothetical protein